MRRLVYDSDSDIDNQTEESKDEDPIDFRNSALDFQNNHMAGDGGSFVQKEIAMMNSDVFDFKEQLICGKAHVVF